MLCVVRRVYAVRDKQSRLIRRSKDYFSPLPRFLCECNRVWLTRRLAITACVFVLFVFFLFLSLSLITLLCSQNNPDNPDMLLFWASNTLKLMGSLLKDASVFGEQRLFCSLFPPAFLPKAMRERERAVVCACACACLRVCVCVFAHTRVFRREMIGCWMQSMSNPVFVHTCAWHMSTVCAGGWGLQPCSQTAPSRCWRTRLRLL